MHFHCMLGMNIKVRQILCPVYMSQILLWFAVILLTITTGRNGLFFTRTNQAGSKSCPTQVRCAVSKAKPGPTTGFDERTSSDRFVAGTKPVLIKGARVWTGENNGTEVVSGDVLLDKGIIQRVGHLSASSLAAYGTDLVVIDANGAWITPGLVNIRSHHGISPSPHLDGAADANSLQSTIQPWLRSLDALNTHDDSYLLAIAGGTTTALVLPAFTSAIGGEGYAIKLRDTSEHSPSSMLLEPYQSPAGAPTRWRYVVHACGERPSKAHNNTRMDNMWALRHAYTRAKMKVQREDDCCSGQCCADNLSPEDYGWELLAEVLRGNGKVHVHCNEAEDLDGIIRVAQPRISIPYCSCSFCQ